MPSANLTQATSKDKVGKPGVDFSQGSTVAQAIPQVLSQARSGAALVKLGERLPPAWQATAPRFLGQVSAANNHYYDKGESTMLQRFRIHEGDAPVVRGRPVTEDGAPIYSGDVNYIDWRLFDVNSATPADVIESEVLTAADTMSAALQVTSGWRRDAKGYTFEHTMPHERFLEGGRVYRAEYVFVRNVGAPVKHAVELEVMGLYTPSWALQ